MSSITKQLIAKYQTNQLCAFIMVSEGGGTGNEAASARLGRYLHQVLGMEVRYLAFRPNLNMIHDTDPSEFDINLTSREKLIKQNVPDELIVKLEKDLLTHRRYIVFGAADTHSSSEAEAASHLQQVMKKAVEKKGFPYRDDAYLGFVNLSPFAWHSDERSVYDAKGNKLKFPCNMPIRADFPEVTKPLSPLQIGGLNQQPPHALTSLVNSMIGDMDIMVTYGLHVLFDEPDEYRWVARGFTGLALGTFKYLKENSDSSILLLALHPRNNKDQSTLSNAAPNDVIVYAKNANSAIQCSESKIHVLPSDADKLDSIVADIAQFNKKQLVIIQKTANDKILPDSFNALLDSATLPVLSEGANTIGQLYQLHKNFWTIAEADKQLPNLNTELASYIKWQDLLTQCYSVAEPSQEVKGKIENYSKDDVANTQLTSKGRKVSLDLRQQMVLEDIGVNNLGTITNLVAASILSQDVAAYLKRLTDIEALFLPELLNQVVLALTLLFQQQPKMVVSISNDRADDVKAISDILQDGKVTDFSLIQSIQQTYLQGKPYSNKQALDKQLREFASRIPESLYNELLGYLDETYL